MFILNKRIFVVQFFNFMLGQKSVSFVLNVSSYITLPKTKKFTLAYSLSLSCFSFAIVSWWARFSPEEISASISETNRKTHKITHRLFIELIWHVRNCGN